MQHWNVTDLLIMYVGKNVCSKGTIHYCIRSSVEDSDLSFWWIQPFVDSTSKVKRLKLTNPDEHIRSTTSVTTAHFVPGWWIPNLAAVTSNWHLSEGPLWSVRQQHDQVNNSNWRWMLGTNDTVIWSANKHANLRVASSFNALLVMKMGSRDRLNTLTVCVWDSSCVAEGEKSAGKHMHQVELKRTTTGHFSGEIPGRCCIAEPVVRTQQRGCPCVGYQARELTIDQQFIAFQTGLLRSHFSTILVRKQCVVLWAKNPWELPHSNLLSHSFQYPCSCWAIEQTPLPRLCPAWFLLLSLLSCYLLVEHFLVVSAEHKPCYGGPYKSQKQANPTRRSTANRTFGGWPILAGGAP